jgi:hypothetical protein
MSFQGSMIPISEAASHMGTTEMNILVHINRGLLAGEESDEGWFINFDSMVALMNKSGCSKTDVVIKSSCASCSGSCS